MQKITNVPQLPAHVKKAIEQITSQIEYLQLIRNAPPPVDVLIELQYNKDEFIKIPQHIFITNIFHYIESEIAAKQYAISLLEKSFILFHKQHEMYIAGVNVFTQPCYNINVERAVCFCNPYKSNAVVVLGVDLNYFEIRNRFDFMPIPDYILNTINL